MKIKDLHRWVGLGAALFGLVLALSGAVLSIAPLTEAATTGSLVAPSEVSLPTLLQAIVEQVDGVTRVEKTANHAVIVHFETANGFGRTHFDARTLTPIQPLNDGSVMSVVKNLHRSFLAGDVGRGIAGLTALAMLVLCASGIAMIVRHRGGWRALFNPPTTGRPERLHLSAARIAATGLLLASVTGVLLSLATFEIIPSDSGAQPDFPVINTTSTPATISQMPALQSVTFPEFRGLVFSYDGDPTDAYQLTTTSGSGYINPYSGQLENFAPHGAFAKFYETIYLLHTGQGAWVIGLMLGLTMLAVPFVIASGIAMTLKRSRNPLKGIKFVPAQSADTIILVGSEGATTWGFTAEFARKLIAVGKKVHVAEMNALATEYPNGTELFLLTSTYGAGAAPANAQLFLAKLEKFKFGNLRCAILGFGDKTFSEYCKFADDIDEVLTTRRAHRLCPVSKIDRQSAQSFNAWGNDVANALGISLDLRHSPTAPKTTRVQVISKQTFGEQVQAPVSIIRFNVKGLRRIPPHSAGDLLGVFAPGCPTPRYYSLASNHREGWIEICVRKQPGGLCSGYLFDLEIGNEIDVFIMQNPMFKVAKTKAPLVLVGAGAGLAPLVGFLRENSINRPVHLFWGGRDPQSDYLYQDELASLCETGHLTQLTATFSRPKGGGYVQAKLMETARELQNIVASGGQIMVCGGQAMGADVHDIFDKILNPIGLDVNALKQQRRYVEDVY